MSQENWVREIWDAAWGPQTFESVDSALRTFAARMIVLLGFTIVVVTIALVIIVLTP